MYETTMKKDKNRYIKIPYHVVQDSSLLTSLPSFTSQGAMASPAGPSDPSSHSDARPRGDATPGSGGIVVVANGDVVTEDGNDDSVPMEKTRLSHVEVPPEVTWVDKKKTLARYIFLSKWEVSTKSRDFHELYIRITVFYEALFFSEI